MEQLYRRLVLTVMAVVGAVGCNTKKIEDLQIANQELVEETKAQQTRLVALASAQAASSATTQTIEARLGRVEAQTETIGVFHLGWSTLGLAGVNALTVVGRVPADPAKCNVQISTTYSNKGLLPTAAKVEVSKHGGEVILQTVVDLSSGSAKFEVSAPCATLNAVAVHS